jgi:hypothetical protein
MGAEVVFVAVQGFVLLFLLLHDWVPLGPFNDLEGVNSQILLIGESRAWWKPYLLRADPKLVQRYQAMFGKTHAFLPKRNGIVPNTAHVVLHACTLLAFLLALSVGK